MKLDKNRSIVWTFSDAQNCGSLVIDSLLKFPFFEDDFVENYFQWGEADEEDSDMKETSGVDRPPRNEFGIESAAFDHSFGNPVETNSDDVKKCKLEAERETGVPSEESMMDGKESFLHTSSSTQEDVEYHIKHCECSLCTLSTTNGPA